MKMIVLQPACRKLLARAVARGRVAHAYLFVGPEGAGKRTLAREFAAALVCDRREFPTCRECGPCRRVSAGNHPDVFLVDPETRSILIRQIKDLGARLRYHSFEGGYKVGIVTEAERMTEEAKNAFLKNLEEPPSDTVLILTCTNLNRMLPTIISRCQVLRFSPLAESEVESLVRTERGLAEEEARLVAALAQGSATRALDMDLEFVVRFRKEMITRLLELGPKDRIALLAFAEEVAKVQYEAEAVFDLLAGFYRDVIHFKLGRQEVRNLDLIESIHQLARGTSLGRLFEQVEAIHQARVRAAGNANPRLNWELLAMTLTGFPGAELRTP